MSRFLWVVAVAVAVAACVCGLAVLLQHDSGRPAGTTILIIGAALIGAITWEMHGAWKASALRVLQQRHDRAAENRHAESVSERAHSVRSPRQRQVDRSRAA